MVLGTTPAEHIWSYEQLQTGPARASRVLHLRRFEYEWTPPTNGLDRVVVAIVVMM